MRVGFVNQEKLLCNLKQLGFFPKTIFDIGVAKGTPWLYLAYPGAYYYLIEPVESFTVDIQSLLLQFPGVHIKAALGSKPGRASFYIPKDLAKHQISTLSFKTEMVPTETIVELEVTTLDNVTKDRNVLQPILLKTDCQGHDLEVAKGAIETLKFTDVVITETPVYGPWGGGAELKDYIDFYYANNFILYDMVEPLRRPDDDRLHSIDLCFVNLNSPIAQRGLYTSGKETLSKSRKFYGI